MRLNTGFVFCALVCLSTILHPACGSPLPSSSNRLPLTPSPSNSGSSGQDSDSDWGSGSEQASPSPRPLTPESQTLRFKFYRGTGPAPIGIETDLLKNYIREGLKYYGSTKLDIRNPLIDTDHVSLNVEGDHPEPMKNSHLRDDLQELVYGIQFLPAPGEGPDFLGSAILTIQYNSRLRAPVADRRTAKMHLFIFRLDWSQLYHSLDSQRRVVGPASDQVRIGPGSEANLRFTNPNPNHPLEVGPVIPEATSNNHEGGHGAHQSH
ncbi:hypothetical protein FB446DRAFT_745930 [Lentinula raphanica]|nr:hypothetical protein FB446DRAFT_745930 [Lentinula raphanica]